MSKINNVIRIDLHCHSHYSDGLSTVKDIEAKCTQTGISAVITDHNEIRGSIELYNRNKILTMPALEVGTKEGLEFLIYFNTVPEIESFYKKLIEPYRVNRFMVRMNLTIEKLLMNLDEYQCYISLAHPFGFGKKSIRRQKNNFDLINLIEKKIHGVEILNGNTIKSSNNKALEYFRSLRSKGLTAGSDGHYLNSICSVYTEFDKVNQPEKSVSLYDLLHNENRRPIQEKRINMLYTCLIISYEHTKYFINNGKNI